MNTLIDPSTGLPPWEIVRVDVRNEPSRSALGNIVKTERTSVEITVIGHVHVDKQLFRKVFHFYPHGDVVIENVDAMKANGTTTITLREYQKPIMGMRKTRLRLRYKYAGPNRWAVHENRGDVLGYIRRTASGYEIEGRHYTAKTMRGVLKYFRNDDLGRLSEEMKRDILTVNEQRDFLGLSPLSEHLIGFDPGVTVGRKAIYNEAKRLMVAGKIAIPKDDRTIK